MSNSDQQKKEKQHESTQPTQSVEDAAQTPKPATTLPSQGPTIEELTDLLQRNQASFENYRKQVQQRITESEQMALKKFLGDFLLIVDTLHLALKNSNHDAAVLQEGLDMVYSQILSLLEKQGVATIATVGNRFDPVMHQALAKVPDLRAAETVIEEFQKGYLLHGRVLRPARVKISSGPDKKSENKKE